MIEVEVKAKINNPEKIREKLNSLRIEKIKEEFQEDIYFSSPIADFSKTDEALRIRKTTNESDEKIIITYKGPKIDKSSKTREEIETVVESKENLKTILEKVGFNPVRIVKKRREFYKYEKFEISLDFVEGLPPYMEIESILTDKTPFDKVQDEIFEIFKKLGIENGFERTSYMELLENQNSN